MSDQEKRLELLESQFPLLSGATFEEACREALASGHSVLQSHDGVIYEVHPDGSRKPVKQVPLPTPVKRGLKIKIR